MQNLNTTMQKKILLTLALLLSMAKLYAKEKSFSVQPVSVKVGCANVGYIFNFLPEKKTIESECKSFERQLKKQLEVKSEEFQQKAKAFQQSYEAMTEAVRNKKQLELQQLHGGLEQLQLESEEKLVSKSAGLLGPVYDKITNAIEQVAKKNGYTHILNVSTEPFSALLYADEKYDISDLVLRELGIDLAEAKSKK
jgi:outer membrane protein